MPNLTGLRHFFCESIGPWSQVHDYDTGAKRYYWLDFRVPRFVWAYFSQRHPHA